MGGAALQLGVLAERPARADARAVDLRRVLPALVRELPRHRRSESHRRRLRELQRHRHPGRADFGWRRLAPEQHLHEPVLRLKPTASVTTQPFTGTSDRLFPGSNVIDRWNGFDISVNARLGRGVILQGGTSTGRQVTDNCDIVDPANASKFGGHTLLGTFANLANLAPLGSVVQSVQACHVEQAWQTQIKFLGSYTIPKVDVLLGASYQNIPGIELAANYAVPNSQILAQLGHLPPGATVNGITTVSLIPPESTYYDRINQMDLRIG